ncbi:MAG TPA: GNAT family N-acetyltransferase [Solirubrobacterales bacterium]
MSGDREQGGGDLQVELVSDLAALHEEWSALAERTGNVFATWEWASAWWRHLGGDRPLYLATFRDRGRRLVAILPLFLASRRPLRVVRLVGHGPGDELGPICDPADLDAVVPAIRSALDLIRPRWDVLIADNLPSDPAWATIRGATQLNEIPNPVFEIGGMSWDEFFESRSGKFRQQVRRNTRRLADDHDLAYRLAEDPSRLDADLDTLFTLHQARWREESSGVFAGAEGEMQREFAKSILGRGWLRLWLLELDGEPVAARLGFRFGDVECGYQSGRNRAWDKYGVGFLLQAHVVKEAMNDGMSEYRLLRGGEKYKDRLANANRSLETLAIARGVAGRGALAVGRAVLSLPPERRRWLSKVSGNG